MNLLDEVSNDLVNESASLSNTLRKAKVLAGQISLPEFKEWLDLELGGYSGKDKVPEYRSVQPVNLGTFSGPFGSGVKNMAIPTYNLPDSVKEYAENLIIYDGIGALAGMLSQSSAAFTRKWPPEFVILSQEATRLSGAMILVDAYQPIPQYFISGVLDNVKNKLLDFVLAMQESSITSEDLDNRTVKPAVARTIFNTVNVYGNNAVVASGETVTQEVTSVPRGDMDSLMNRLRELGVSDTDLTELKDAISSDPDAPNGEFGPKLHAWMGRMVEKAASGTLKVGIETASKVLLESLKGFFGS